MKWNYAVRREPPDVRLGRVRHSLAELAAEGQLHCAAGEDGQLYYWA